MVESLRDKLRRLRREDAGSPPAATPTSAISPLDQPLEPPATESRVTEVRALPQAAGKERAPLRGALAERLARRGERLGKHRDRRAELRPVHAPSTERAEGAGSPLVPTGSEVETTSGAPRALEQSALTGVAARSSVFAREHTHGSWRLAEALTADSETLALLAKDATLLDRSLEHALFLDTETTGLSGGAGTYVFLVGLGSFTPSGFEVWQGFLPDPSMEKALLAETAQRIARAPLLVTFFGKSFDRHRLEDKMRLHGVEPPFAGKPHLDLYHPLRRLYGKALLDTRLKTLERALCGVARPNDLPGSLAPAAWFDFLAGRPHRLEGVFAHNLDDVLSLVTLAAHAGRARGGDRERASELQNESAWRALGVARLYTERREHAAALDALRGASTTTSETLRRAHAIATCAACVRLGRLAEARAGLEPWIERELDLATAIAHVELLVAEHRARAAVPERELERLSTWMEHHAVGRERARLSAGLNAILRTRR